MIVIIGGSKGLGLSLAEEFSADNKVVTISRNQQAHSKNNIKSIKFDINKDDPSLLDKYFSKKDVSAVFFTVGLVNPGDDINLEFSEIEKIHGFGEPQGHCKVAINNDLVQWDAKIEDGDKVLFFPPVSGG